MGTFDHPTSDREHMFGEMGPISPDTAELPDGYDLQEAAMRLAAEQRAIRVRISAVDFASRLPGLKDTVDLLEKADQIEKFIYEGRA